MPHRLITNGHADSGNTPRFEITLLGEFAVRHGNATLSLSADAQRLVAFLALQGRRIARSLVAGTLWLNKSQERASGNLRSTLWRLRLQATDIVDADARSLCLAPDISVDIHETTELATAICSGASCDTYSTELFLQELLPGWYEDWVLVEQERIRQQSLHALESIATALSAKGHHAAAVQAALHAIRIDPLRESAHRCLISIHLAEGNDSEAFRQFEVYKAFLSNEIGLAPSQKVMDLLRDAVVTLR